MEENKMVAQYRQSVITTYRKRAKRYDFTSSLYYLIGFRIEAYRRHAVATLNLQPGDTVVDLGCGTGPLPGGHWPGRHDHRGGPHRRYAGESTPAH